MGLCNTKPREAVGKSPPSKLSDAARKELDSFNATSEGLNTVITNLKAASDEGTGWAAGAVTNLVPGGGSLVNKYRDQATNDAIQQLTYYTDEIRHGRFGTALTNTEKASAAQYLPGEYDTKDQMLNKAIGLKALVLKNNQRLQLTGGSTPAPRGGNTPEWNTSNTSAPAAPTQSSGWKIEKVQ